MEQHKQEELDVMEAVETTDLMDLVVFNDDVNTFDHVIATLICACKHTPEPAEPSAWIVHHEVECAVESGSFEFLQLYREAICEARIDASTLSANLTAYVEFSSKLLEEPVDQVSKRTGI